MADVCRVLEGGEKIPVGECVGVVAGDVGPAVHDLVGGCRAVGEGGFEAGPAEVEAGVADARGVPVDERDDTVVLPEGVAVVEVAMDEGVAAGRAWGVGPQALC